MTFDAAGSIWFVLDTSLRACAAAAAVALLLRVLRMRAAAVQHSAWAAVLGAMLLMPVLPSLVPAIPLPMRVPVGGLLDATALAGPTAPPVVAEVIPPSSGRSSEAQSFTATVTRSVDTR